MLQDQGPHLPIELKGQRRLWRPPFSTGTEGPESDLTCFLSCFLPWFGLGL